MRGTEHTEPQNCKRPDTVLTHLRLLFLRGMGGGGRKVCRSEGPQAMPVYQVKVGWRQGGASGSGLFEVYSRGKNLSIWADFCLEDYVNERFPDFARSSFC
jgi:hypothetical protein